MRPRFKRIAGLAVAAIFMVVWGGLIMHVLAPDDDAEDGRPPRDSKPATAARITGPPPPGPNDPPVSTNPAVLQKQLQEARHRASQLQVELTSLHESLKHCQANQAAQRLAAFRTDPPTDPPPPLEEDKVQAPIPDPKAQPPPGGDGPPEDSPEWVPPSTILDSKVMDVTAQQKGSLGAPPGLKDTEGTIAILLLCYNRALDVRRLINDIKARTNNLHGYRLFVSQDGVGNAQLTRIIEEEVMKDQRIVHLVHRRDDSGATDQERDNHWEAYYAISHHYGWALEQVFASGGGRDVMDHNERRKRPLPLHHDFGVDNHGRRFKPYDNVIILEEDLRLAPDFFSYMSALAPVLTDDETLLCVSGFNDNGKPEAIDAGSRQLYRSDFFPGLGWMMPRRLWHEIRRKWPKGFWDDWLRQPRNRNGRACIRPEVSRSRPQCSASEGASAGQFCAEHLSKIVLADASHSVDWSTVDLGYLAKAKYDAQLRSWLDRARSIPTPFVVKYLPPPTVKQDTPNLKLVYKNDQDFIAVANAFGLMPDFKDSVPRTAYAGGVVTFTSHSFRVHLVPQHPLYKSALVLT